MAACTVSGGQTKRTSDCLSPLTERPGKIPQVDVQACNIELTICYAASGENFAKLKMSNASYVSDLKLALKEHMGPGKVIQGFLKGDILLQENQSLEANGLANGVEVKAIVGSKPQLFVSHSDANEHMFGSDDEYEGDDFSDEPQNISKAPEVALEVANAMMAVAPSLHEMVGVVGGDCVPDGAYVVVIANPGDDTKKACLQALKTPQNLECCDPSYDENEPDLPPVWRCATFKDEDWSTTLETGFNRMIEQQGFNSEREIQDKRENERITHDKQILAITKVMSEKLHKHFTFGFSDDVISAPMLYGGYANDGSIVGVLSRRCWA